MEYLVPLVVIAVLVLLNGLFVAAEFGIVGSSKTRLNSMALEGSKGAEAVLSIRRDNDRMNRYIATAQVGITIVSLGLGMYGEPVLAGWMSEAAGHHDEGHGHSPWFTLAAILLLTYPHVVIGEMVPKALALQNAVGTAIRLRHVMGLIEKLFLPLVVALNAIGNGLLRLFRIPAPDETMHLFSPEEIEMVVHESREGGLVGDTEELMIENIFDLSERTAVQVMTPRTRLVGIPADLDIAEALAQVCNTRYSRHPVYQGDLDTIQGLLYTKDLARHYAHHGTEGNLKDLLRPVRFVPESTPAEELLALFRRERIQFAVVLDEYGGTAGVVTLEDVVEEVVGEIQDEFDQELPPLRELRPNVYEVRGDLLLEELSQTLRLDLEHPTVDTVGGLVMAQRQGLPAQGDTVEWERLRLTVLAMSKTSVERVRLEVL